MLLTGWAKEATSGIPFAASSQSVLVELANLDQVLKLLLLHGGTRTTPATNTTSPGLESAKP